MSDSVRRLFTSQEREAVFTRCKGICGICKRPVPADRFHVDHIVALATGGTNDIANLQVAHGICNITKSARERPSWQEPDTPSTNRRKGYNVYEHAFGFVEYAVAVRDQDGQPFVPVERAPDRGRFIRTMDDTAIAELLEHGAYLVDARGEAVSHGRDAVYFFWPHVATVQTWLKDAS
jgi:hypothetical protein